MHLEFRLRDDRGDVQEPASVYSIPIIEAEGDIYIRISSRRGVNNPIRNVSQEILEALSESTQVINVPDYEEGLVKQISFFRLSGEAPPPDDVASSPPTVFCKICMEPTSVYDSFSTGSCSHVFCSECIGQHIASKVEEYCSVIRCPEEDCKAVLEPELCRSIIPFEVFERWGKILCEISIGEPLRFYCPYKDCSALLLDDHGRDEVITQAECPHCCRLFCAQCKVPWHDKIECVDYQKLGKDERQKEDIQLRNLAKDKKWGRCKKCGYYVEKTAGCSYMVCRCKYAFCYYCGAHREGHRYYCHACKH